MNVALGLAALGSWLADVGSGGYMLGRWVSRGGLHEQRARRDRLGPAVIFTHFGLATTGLVIWVSYLATGWAALAWSAVVLLMPAIGLGLSAVTTWTPYPSPGTPGPASGMLSPPAEDVITRRLTDAVLVRALTDEVLTGRLIDEVLAGAAAGPARPGRRPRGHMAALLPAGHGLAAVTTFLLVVLTAVGT
jgi:hypothetical protein